MNLDQPPPSPTTSPRSTARIARTVLGALILGALGSGLWEVLLRDFFFATGNFTLSLVSMVWSGYVDVLHRDIGKLYPDQLVVPLFAITIVSFGLGLVTYTRRIHRRVIGLREAQAPRQTAPRPPEDVDRQIRLLERMIKFSLWPLVFVYLGMLVVLAWQTTYTRSAANWAERSIELVAPAITNAEYLKLRAQLRSVDRASKYYALQDVLTNAARVHSVQLPAFVAVGRK